MEINTKMTHVSELAAKDFKAADLKMFRKESKVTRHFYSLLEKVQRIGYPTRHVSTWPPKNLSEH